MRRRPSLPVVGLEVPDEYVLSNPGVVVVVLPDKASAPAEHPALLIVTARTRTLARSVSDRT
jgi:hypothetical protein